MAPKRGGNCPISGRRKCVESCHVCGCHGFLGPDSEEKGLSEDSGLLPHELVRKGLFLPQSGRKSSLTKEEHLNFLNLCGNGLQGVYRSPKAFFPFGNPNCARGHKWDLRGGGQGGMAKGSG